MPQYLDTCSGEKDQCLGVWLERNVTAEIKSFKAQFGYFNYGAISQFCEILTNAANNGNPVHLVLGSNNGCLTSSHLRWTLEIIENTQNSSLIVVSFINAKFHSKTVHITRKDDTEVTYVGSANLTVAGLGRNVEAGIVLDSALCDELSTINKISTAIDYWRNNTGLGVYPIRSNEDITRLESANLLNNPQYNTMASTAASRGMSSSESFKSSRKNLWTPKAISITQKSQMIHGKNGSKLPTGLGMLRWCKELKPADAQQNAGNKTGNIRLVQARHPINAQRFFRYNLFTSADWKATTDSKGHAKEVSDVKFNVTVNSKFIGNLTLTVDHAPHREAGQRNHTTVLNWGTKLSEILRKTSHVGEWMSIERLPTGRYLLKIQKKKPNWCPT